MNWKDQLNTLHRRAMEHVDAAHYYERQSDPVRTDLENRRALELEEQAVDLLTENGSSEPTLTILLRGAATLALRCRELERAERLAAKALLGYGPDSLKQDARDVIRVIRLERYGYQVRPLKARPGSRRALHR